MAINEKTRQLMIKQTAEVYRIHAKALRAAESGVKAMDGKMLNARVDKAVEEAIKAKIQGNYYMETVTSGGTFKLRGSCMDNSYRILDENGEATCSVGYTDNRSEVFEIGTYADMFSTTPAGKWKVKADAIIPAMELTADNMEEMAEKTEAILDEIREMEQEFQAIADSLRTFQKKFSWAAQELTGLRYDLRYSGPFETKNYKVRV